MPSDNESEESEEIIPKHSNDMDEILGKRESINPHHVLESSHIPNSESPEMSELSNNYFVYNNCIYKQVHRCAMGSPVSPIVANLCMEVVEELAINTSTVAPRVWKRYVDDSFVIIKKDAVSSFHDALNSIDPKIAFTIEEENNGQISWTRLFEALKLMATHQ